VIDLVARPRQTCCMEGSTPCLVAILGSLINIIDGWSIIHPCPRERSVYSIKTTKPVVAKDSILFAPYNNNREDRANRTVFSVGNESTRLLI